MSIRQRISDVLLEGVIKLTVGYDEITVFTNPVQEQVETVLRKAPYRNGRGIVNVATGEIWIWDADKAAHQDIYSQLDDENPEHYAGFIFAHTLKDALDACDWDQDNMDTDITGHGYAIIVNFPYSFLNRSRSFIKAFGPLDDVD